MRADNCSEISLFLRHRGVKQREKRGLKMGKSARVLKSWRTLHSCALFSSCWCNCDRAICKKDFFSRLRSIKWRRGVSPITSTARALWGTNNQKTNKHILRKLLELHVAYDTRHTHFTAWDPLIGFNETLQMTFSQHLSQILAGKNSWGSWHMILIYI